MASRVTSIPAMNQGFLSKYQFSPFDEMPLQDSSSGREESSVLGAGFKPSGWDVICGRGKHSIDHIGNRRFRIIVAMNLQRYVEAKTRIDKSIVVNSIVDQIREASPSGGFVKKNSRGQWFEIGTIMARDKVGHALRDCMTEPLRRSSQSSVMEKRASLRDAQDNIFRSLRLESYTES